MKKIISFLIIIGILFGVSQVLKLPNKIINQYYFEKKSISNEVNGYENKIKLEVTKNNLESSWINVIKAQMMQESGGQGNDPMQVSESACGKIGCITDPNESIEKGIKLISTLDNMVKKKNIQQDKNTVLQAYNFGAGYINFLAEKKYEKRTEENSKEFSKKLCGQYGTSMRTAVNLDMTACYGDYLYIEHLNRYLN
jgi:hypothetical protein